MAPLLGLLRDDDPTVRRAAAVALGNIVARLPREGFPSPPGIPAVAEPVAELLRDQDADVRWAAVQALGTMKMPEAVTPLIELLKEQDANVRRDAATALGRIGSAAQSAIPALKALLQDRDASVARAADEALQKIETAAKVSSHASAPGMTPVAPWGGTNENLTDPLMSGGDLQPGQSQRPFGVPPPVLQPRSAPGLPVGRR
jgi:HEAT repeat protein